MISKFPFSMEQLPRHRHCGCFSLRFGSILTALVVILYSLLALSQCIAMLITNYPEGDDTTVQLTIYIIVICVLSITFLLSALMLLGVLRELNYLIRPWVVWQSIQLAATVLIFIVGNAVRVASAFEKNTLILCAAEFLIILIKFFMLTVVASYSRMLEERSDETQRLKSADIDTCYTDL